MKTAYLGLGSNLGDREANLRAALAALESPTLHVRRVSSIYETEPLEVHRQRWFLNLVAEVETQLFPLQMLSRAKAAERALGRRPTIPKGPRTIDIDILLFGAFCIRTTKLTVPHPEMQNRRFVLLPLAELAPDLRHPVDHRSVREMLEAAPYYVVRKFYRSPAASQEIMPRSAQ